jgi:hypothetical protein
MAKNFKGGLDSLISKRPTKSTSTKKGELAKRRGRPKTSTKVPKDTTEEGTLPGEKRATFIVKEELLDKVKNIAYWDRVKIKNVLEEALQKHISTWEKKHGPVKQPK